jgi:hypothetical protein
VKNIKFILDSVGYCERGDAVNARSYYYALRDLLGIPSVLTFDANAPHNNFSVIDALKREGIPLFAYSSQADLHAFAKREQISHAYFYKAGFYDERWVPGVRNCVHAVFNVLQPHGDVYAYLSEWLFREQFKKTAIPWPEDQFRQIQAVSGSSYFPNLGQGIGWVPPIVSPPSPSNPAGFRSRLAIPKSAKVVGRIGGMTTFEDPEAQRAVISILNQNPSIYFVFVNTAPFYQHERIRYVDAIISDKDKADFFCACDLTLNGRLGGESFGFGVCESLYYGVPVIGPALSRNPNMDAHHVDLLSALNLLYSDADSLVALMLAQIESPVSKELLRSVVEKFSPANVMSQFRSVFIGV